MLEPGDIWMREISLMDDLNLTVQVLNISPATKRGDLIAFFSYCGTVDKIQLKKDDESSQSAYVTFRQPYAVRTALLLNDSILGDRHVKILRAPRYINIPVILCSSKNHERSGGGVIPTAQSAVQLGSLRGEREALNKAKETAIHAGKTVLQQANSALIAAEQTAGGIGSAIFSKGAFWVSGMLDRASKSVAELAGAKAQNWKQK